MGCVQLIISQNWRTVIGQTEGFELTKNDLKNPATIWEMPWPNRFVCGVPSRSTGSAITVQCTEAGVP